MKLLRLSYKELQGYIDAFIVEHLKEKSDETKGTYKRSLKEFQRYYAISASRFYFSKESVQEYKKHLTENKSFSQATVSTYLTALRRLLDFFLTKNIIDVNPAKGVRGYKRPEKHSVRPLAETEVAKLLSIVPLQKPQDFRDYLMIRLMIEGAVSEIELVNLNVEDIVLYPTHYLLFVQGKGKKTKEQSVEVSLSLGKLIQDYVSKRTKKAKKGEPMFVSHSNRVENARMTTRAIHYRLSYWLRESGLPMQSISPNSLRHTAAKMWLDRDKLPLEEVKKRMRHRMISTTKFYLKS